jgi:crossover junction endodeoxyribonuclease RusA
MQLKQYTLPFPPSVNSCYRSVGHRTLLSKRGREYVDEAGICIASQGHVSFGDSRVSVSIMLCPPDKRRRDLDNYFKATLDALTKNGVWDDDSQVDYLCIARCSVVKHGEVIVSIRTIV